MVMPVCRSRSAAMRMFSATLFVVSVWVGGCCEPARTSEYSRFVGYGNRPAVFSDRAVLGERDGVVHMSLEAGDHAATYLARTLTARKPATVTAWFGSDDGLAVWLNGKKLISNDIMRGVIPGSDTAKLALNCGA